MKYKARTRVGVDFHRLICAGARCVEKRQINGLARLKQCSNRALRHLLKGSSRRVHTNYGHMWDEVRVKCRWKASRKFRMLKKR